MNLARLMSLILFVVVAALPYSQASAQVGVSLDSGESHFVSCSQMSTEMLTKAQSFGSCSELDGQLAPMNTVIGNCGSSTLEFSAGGGGILVAFVGTTSSVGPIFGVTYNIPWSNYTNGRSGNIINDVYLPGTSNTWSYQDYDSTGVGAVGGVAEGYTWTGGGYCTWLLPSSTAWVS